MTTQTGYVVHQIARPTGFPLATDFAYVRTPVPTPAPGTALVHNLLLSVDPYHRGLMDGGEGGFGLNTPLEGARSGGSSPPGTPGWPKATSSSTGRAGARTRWSPWARTAPASSAATRASRWRRTCPSSAAPA